MDIYLPQSDIVIENENIPAMDAEAKLRFAPIQIERTLEPEQEEFVSKVLKGKRMTHFKEMFASYARIQKKRIPRPWKAVIHANKKLYQTTADISHYLRQRKILINNEPTRFPTEHTAPFERIDDNLAAGNEKWEPQVNQDAAYFKFIEENGVFEETRVLGSEIEYIGPDKTHFSGYYHLSNRTSGEYHDIKVAEYFGSLQTLREDDKVLLEIVHVLRESAKPMVCTVTKANRETITVVYNDRNGDKEYVYEHDRFQHMYMFRLDQDGQPENYFHPRLWFTENVFLDLRNYDNHEKIADFFHPTTRIKVLVAFEQAKDIEDFYEKLYAYGSTLDDIDKRDLEFVEAKLSRRTYTFPEHKPRKSTREPKLLSQNIILVPSRMPKPREMDSSIMQQFAQASNSVPYPELPNLETLEEPQVEKFQEAMRQHEDARVYKWFQARQQYAEKARHAEQTAQGLNLMSLKPEDFQQHISPITYHGKPQGRIHVSKKQDVYEMQVEDPTMYSVEQDSYSNSPVAEFIRRSENPTVQYIGELISLLGVENYWKFLDETSVEWFQTTMDEHVSTMEGNKEEFIREGAEIKGKIRELELKLEKTKNEEKKDKIRRKIDKQKDSDLEDVYIISKKTNHKFAKFIFATSIFVRLDWIQYVPHSFYEIFSKTVDESPNYQQFKSVLKFAKNDNEIQIAPKFKQLTTSIAKPEIFQRKDVTLPPWEGFRPILSKHYDYGSKTKLFQYLAALEKATESRPMEDFRYFLEIDKPVLSQSNTVAHFAHLVPKRNCNPTPVVTEKLEPGTWNHIHALPVRTQVDSANKVALMEPSAISEEITNLLLDLLSNHDDLRGELKRALARPDVSFDVLRKLLLSRVGRFVMRTIRVPPPGSMSWLKSPYVLTETQDPERFHRFHSSPRNVIEDVPENEVIPILSEMVNEVRSISYVGDESTLQLGKSFAEAMVRIQKLPHGNEVVFHTCMYLREEMKEPAEETIIADFEGLRMQYQKRTIMDLESMDDFLRNNMAVAKSLASQLFTNTINE